MSRVTEDAASVTDLADAPPGAPALERSGDGRSRRWDAHRAERRDDLTDAVRLAIHHGGPELSMDEIATAIGTSKSIVYRYFSDRSGLQQAVGEAVLRDLGAALAEASHRVEGPHEVVRAMVGVYLEMISTSPSVYTFVTRVGELSDPAGPMRTLADDAAALLAPVLGDVLEGQGRPRATAHLWAAGVIGFVRGSAEVWLLEGADGGATLGIDNLADTLADWICSGTLAAVGEAGAPAPALTNEGAHHGR